MLHLLNGDAVLPSMEESGLPGDARVWGDVLWEGPHFRAESLFQGVPRWEEIEARARYFAASDREEPKLIAMARRWDEALESAPSHDEVVIWLEHDLHDQLLLIRHLAWFTSHRHPKVSLICIGEFPGVVPFHGLGQLNGAQLASLFPHRRLVTKEQFELGKRTWDAYLTSTPKKLFEIWQGDTRVLPFLAGALQRFFEEYPAVGTGLSRTERTILELLRDRPTLPHELFPALQQREERVFMGDMSFYGILGRLGWGENRLVDLGADRSLRDPAQITQLGRETLEGRKDRVELQGIRRSLGGVVLDGHKVRWRWDPNTRQIVKTKK